MSGILEESNRRAADEYRRLQAQTFLNALETYRRKHPEPAGEDTPEHAVWERGAEEALAEAMQELQRDGE